MFDAFNQLYVAEFIDVNCNSPMMYTNFNYNMYGQRNTDCEFTVDSFWGMLYNSTKLEQADVSESVTADIVGHEKKTITYGLYSGGSSMAQNIRL